MPEHQPRGRFYFSTRESTLCLCSDWDIAHPGQDYFNGAPDGCPFKNMMNDKGSCQDALKNVDESHCSAYCEVKNTWFHGQEVPIKEFSSCRANSPCEYTTTDTITVTQSFAFNVNAGLAKRSHDADDETGNVTTLGKRGEEGVLKPSFNLVRLPFSLPASTGEKN